MVGTQSKEGTMTNKQPLGIFDVSGGLTREQEIEIVNRIRVQAGGQPLTEEEIAESEAELAAELANEVNDEQ